MSFRSSCGWSRDFRVRICFHDHQRRCILNTQHQSITPRPSEFTITRVNTDELYSLLFPNEEWGSKAKDSDLNAVVSQLRVCTHPSRSRWRILMVAQPSISFYQRIENNFTTLSTQNADRDGTVNGFLYVPDINKDDECYELSKEYLPNNVTRQSNLPPADFTLIALAPWINAECSYAWLTAAREDPARTFLFYLPENSTAKPPDALSSIWALQDDWQSVYKYPVYIIPGTYGLHLMHNLALYSGNMTSVPWGHTISELPGIDARDYVRLYTQLSIGRESNLPSFWVLLLIIFVFLFLVAGTTSASMHLIQRARRKSLQRRVANGEVNLEALGIKRFTLPQSLIEELPLFTYSAEPDISPPMSPASKIQSPTITAYKDAENIDDRATISTSPMDNDTPPRLITVDDNVSEPGSLFMHKFLPYSQPTCPICLEDFESGVSEIRELPCGHIYHPTCIDIFLMDHSSLCPLCKKTAFPLGYCPAKITNAMVSRERALRNLRSRVTNLEPGAEESGELDTPPSRFQSWKSSIQRTVSKKSSTELPPLQPQLIYMTSAIQDAPSTHHNSFGSRSRTEFVQQRIRDLAARMTPIGDPDLVSDRRLPQCEFCILFNKFTS